MIGPGRTPAGGAPPVESGTVGPYTLLAPIGEGGMGVVHLARRTADGRRGERVALKVLRPHIIGDIEARARLEREVASLGRIRSRWVAGILDADPWGPVPYVATRYVPGLSLHDHVVDEGPILGRDLVRFAAALAAGLASVHAVGVLHRDVKPSNVLLEGRTPILIDFGLARVAEDPRLTHTGFMLGTPGYLAPEILFGEDATTASDVHSWAATVAYAGTGRPPFGRGPSMAILDRVRRGEHDLAGLPHSLRRLVSAALAVAPHERPTLAEVIDVLVSLGAGSGDVAPQTTALYAVLGEGRDREGETMVLTEGDTAPQWVEPDEPRRSGRWPESLRRGVLLLAGFGAVSAAVAAYPLYVLVVVSFLVWLLRSGSLAASAAGVRRERRGRKWYDGIQALLLTPWDLVRAIPGAVLLLVWGVCVGLSAGLIAFAVRGEEALALGVAGCAGAIGLWFGPGGSRLRGPVARVVDPLSADVRRWLPACVLVVAAALGFGVLAEMRGVTWDPAPERPLVGQVFHHSGSERGTMTT